jgi:hypothetical protein
MSRFTLFVEEGDTIIMPGVRILDFSGVEAETVDPVEAEDGLALIMDAYTPEQHYVTVGPNETDFRTASVYDNRLRKWTVWPFPANDDFRLQRRKP